MKKPRPSSKGIACFFFLMAFCYADFTSGQGLTVRSRRPTEQAKQDETPSSETNHSGQKPTPPATNGSTFAASEPAQGVTFTNPVRNRWQVGVKVKVGSGTVKNATFTFPVPKNWPEQTVSVVEDEIPANAKIDSRKKFDGIEQLVIRFSNLGPGQSLMITRTYEVSTSQVDAPNDTTRFKKPTSRINEARNYLRPSPGINFQHSKLKRMVKEITKDQPNVWAEVEAIYDWVRDNIEDTATKPRQLHNVFLEKTGCNEDKVSLFVGMCRSHKIPARIVWVQGTLYAEFMLTDGAKQVHWFPCNVGGVREFGSYAEPRIVLQKGDNFRVPEKNKNLKYVSEVFQGQIQKGKTRPKYVFFRKLLPAN